jgi:hypothetical protein
MSDNKNLSVENDFAVNHVKEWSPPQIKDLQLSETENSGGSVFDGVAGLS